MTARQDPARGAEHRLRTLVRMHGGAPENAHCFERDSVALLPYASLGAARESNPDDLAPVLGIYEWQDAVSSYS